MSVSVTGNKLILFIRDQLDETYAKQWPDVKILRALNYAKAKLFLDVVNYQGGEGYFYDHCTIPTQIGVQEYALPDGALYSAAPKCNGHIDFVLDKSTASYPVPKYFNDFRGFHNLITGGYIDYIDIKHNSLWVYPVPNAVFSMELFYFYIPADIAATNTVIDFVPSCEYAIALQAIITSKINVQESIEEVKLELEEFRNAMRMLVGSSRIHGKLRQIGSDEDETGAEDYL